MPGQIRSYLVLSMQSSRGCHSVIQLESEVYIIPQHSNGHPYDGHGEGEAFASAGVVVAAEFAASACGGVTFVAVADVGDGSGNGGMISSRNPGRNCSSRA